MTMLRLGSHSKGLGLSSRRSRRARAVPSYAATPVSFNGSTHLARGGALIGVSDGKTSSGSLWLRLAAEGTFARVFNAASDRFALLYFDDAPADFALFGFNSSGAEVLRVLINGIDDTNWHHFLWSHDQADPGSRHF